jgi:hypothetical protein
MATEQLKKIIADVHARRVVLPQFQRDFVWQPSAVIKLLVSLFNGYPIGSLLLMENNDNYEYRLIDGVPEGPSVPTAETLLILDGQQRLTACYRAFVGSVNAPRYAGRYFFNYADFVKAIQASGDMDGTAIDDYFVFMKSSKALRDLNTTAAEIAAGLFPLDVIFGEPRGSNYSDWLQKYTFNASGGDQEKFDSYARIASKFQSEFIEKVTSYQVNYEKITRDTKPDVICTVFETINTTGVKLTVFDLLVAKSFKKGIRLRDKLEDAVTQFENIRLLDPTGTNIASIHLPRILGLMHNNQCRKGDLLQLPVEAIANNWDRAVVALDKMLGMLRTDFGCVKPEYIPSIDIITPMALIVSDVRFARDVHFQRFARLYWNLVFSSYLSGAPETKSARIVREWSQKGGYMDNEEALPEAIRTFGFSADEMDEATRASVVYKGTMSLLIARGARDLGRDRTLIKAIPPKDVEDHHIYPQQFLRNYGIKGYIANSILNRTPLLALTNRAISANAPHIYLKDVNIVGPSGLEETMRSHAIPDFVVSDGFSADAFSRFRAERRKLLVRLISDATGQGIHAGDALDGGSGGDGGGESVSDELEQA